MQILAVSVETFKVCIGFFIFLLTLSPLFSSPFCEVTMLTRKFRKENGGNALHFDLLIVFSHKHFFQAYKSHFENPESMQLLAIYTAQTVHHLRSRRVRTGESILYTRNAKFMGITYCCRIGFF
jgi:hypothetical protein